MIVSQTGLVFDDLDNFANCWSYCRLPLNWDLSDVFLMIRLGLWVSEREITEVMYHFYYIILRIRSINVIYDC